MNQVSQKVCNLLLESMQILLYAMMSPPVHLFEGFLDVHSFVSLLYKISGHAECDEPQSDNDEELIFPEAFIYVQLSALF